MHQTGKLLIILGAAIVVIGVILYFFDKVPLIGKLPGDIVIRKKNFTFYFPLMTSIILSVVFSLILYFLSKLR